MPDYTPIYQSAGNDFNIDPTLLQAIGQVESSGNPQAASSAGAVGLMGVMPANLRAVNAVNPTDPYQNVYAGTKVLNDALTTANGNLPQALRIYQGGPNQAKWGPQNAAYPAKVAAAYQALKASQPSTIPTEVVRPASAPAPASDPTDDFLTGKTSAPSPAVAPSGSTGAPSAAGAPASSAPDDVDKFLMGTSEPPEEVPGPPREVPSGQVDDFGRPVMIPIVDQPALSVPAPVQNVVQSAVQGAKQGFGSGPLGLSPQSQDAMVRAGIYNAPGEYNPLKAVNQAVINPLATAGDLALRGGSALLGAARGAISQGASELPIAPIEGSGYLRESAASLLNPMLASRDINAAPEAFRTGDIGGGTRLPTPAFAPEASAPEAAATTPRFVSEYYAPLPEAGQSVGDRAMQLIRHDEAERNGQFTETQPNPLMPAAEGQPLQLNTTPAAGAPQSAGAAGTPNSLTGMTPAQVQAYRSTAEGQKLIEQQQPGISDPNVYVPGVTPNDAEIEQTVNMARELKTINSQRPDVSQEAKEIAAQNSDARQQFFANIARSKVDVQNAVDARSAQAEQDLQGAFGNKKPTDAQPVVDTIQGVLATPRGVENTALQQFVKPLVDRLYNADGTLKSDPEQLYGLREDVARMQTKAARAETPTLDHVNGQLQQIKSALDGAIEQGAPGYQQYLANYAEASRPIDTMQALQEFEPKLYGANNQMQYSRVQNMMRQIVDARASPGLNEFKSIPDDAMQNLWALRDDLRRSTSAQDLARAPGSDTAQNMTDILKGVGKSTANVAAHGLIMSHLGPAGNLLYNAARNAVSAGAEARALRQQTARGMQILHPDPSKLRNPLQGP